MSLFPSRNYDQLMLFEVYIRYADVDHGMLGRCETMAFV